MSKQESIQSERPTDTDGINIGGRPELFGRSLSDRPDVRHAVEAACTCQKGNCHCV